MTERTLPRWKKALFAVVILALLLVVIEAAAWAAGTIAFGDRFSRSRLQAQRTGLVESRGRVAGRPRWIDNEILHPYVGFLPAERVRHGRGGVAGITPPTEPVDPANQLVSRSPAARSPSSSQKRGCPT